MIQSGIPEPCAKLGDSNSPISLAFLKMMATGVHTSVYPPPTPGFVQHGHSNSVNAAYSHTPLTSFDAQSVTSTQAQTPPPPRPSSQQQMAYNMNGNPMPNGMMPPNSFNGYPDPNVFAQPPPYFGNGVKPQIYTVSWEYYWTA